MSLVDDSKRGLRFWVALEVIQGGGSIGDLLSRGRRILQVPEATVKRELDRFHEYMGWNHGVFDSCPTCGTTAASADGKKLQCPTCPRCAGHGVEKTFLSAAFTSLDTTCTTCGFLIARRGATTPDGNAKVVP